ncbi:hypothetical protein [Kribbella pratensis]|jgi:hypothetical protein|uniref:Uncharacterized protein n=1 Tax=Kribbella pratensis TaxID=2512112 RepID=A0A4R8CP91_9ACTN|nr:hypothetical protein [Kribbella pratensis]TDW77943.1 hypothetical protein EV653_3126 [Kribbella pratensis]
MKTNAFGQAGHHALEDRPEDIAAASSVWIDHHSLNPPRTARPAVLSHDPMKETE